jgi:hypothetical protein
MERVPAEPGGEGEAADDRPDHGRRGEAFLGRDLREAVDDQRHADRQQRQAEPVELARFAEVGVGQQPPAEEPGDEPDRHVDEEDPGPVQVLQDQAADDRPQDRRQHRGHENDAHHAAHPFRPGDLSHDHLGDRHDHAAADALEDAEEDQRGARPGNPAEGRADREEEDRAEVDALGAEAARRPAGQWDDRGECQQVPGGDPLDLRQGGVKFATQGVEADVDDRRVEDRHRHPQDHDAGDLPDVWLYSVSHSAPKG